MSEQKNSDENAGKNVTPPESSPPENSGNEKSPEKRPRRAQPARKSTRKAPEKKAAAPEKEKGASAGAAAAVQPASSAGGGRRAKAAAEAEMADADSRQREPQDENSAQGEAGSLPESGDAAAAKRKSRRGRRGGRAHSHKKAEAAVYLPVCLKDAPVFPFAHVLAALQGENKAENAAKSTRAAKKISRAKVAGASRKMFISVLPGEQVEVALAQDGVLLEYYLEMLHQSKTKGNIYKGVIHNIDTNLQAAFVSYGLAKNGFLQIDQVHPEYWQTPQDESRKLPPIQKILRPGQEILVQVVKEPTGNKGAFLTTWLSLAGRFLVLTPGQEQIGVSRKVTDPEERARLRELMNGIEPGNGLGVIVRTVGEGATKTTLKNDLQYLKRLWRDIRKKATEVGAPALIHQEPGLSERSVRDYLTEDVGEIWVDNEEEARNVAGMAALLYPRKKDLVHVHDDIRQSIWDRFGLRRQLEQIYSREVLLPSGGRLVFDQTEALMAIDINSGKISGKGNFEAMSFKTNMEAAEAIARQLRLRDIGGQVVIDFIEMREQKHVLEVEKSLRQAMKSDRARHDVARMSSFGLLELVRQRMGSSALSITMEPCPACGGTGLRRNLEWRALHALGELRQKLRSAGGQRYVYEAEPELGLYLLNNKREALREMERDFGKSLEIRVGL